MKGEIAIICTTADPASQNIAQRLLEMGPWEDHGGFRRLGKMSLVIHGERQTLQTGLDRRLEDLGLFPDAVVFASRHESKGGLPWLGGHFTGVIANGNGALSAAAPMALRSFLHNLQGSAPEGFRISAEATHHGPIDMKTPSFFAEIGSTAQQWSDPRAGQAVARSILDLDLSSFPVFLGFGGGHYVERQTRLMFETGIAFGHLFSSYQTNLLDMAILKEASAKSGAGYVFMDRKSLKSEEKKRLSGLLQELGLPVLRSKEIRARFPAL